MMATVVEAYPNGFASGTTVQLPLVVESGFLAARPSKTGALLLATTAFHCGWLSLTKATVITIGVQKSPWFPSKKTQTHLILAIWSQPRLLFHVPL